VARHLLLLEHPARILALAGGTVHAVAQRIAVGRAAAAEVVALDDALKPLADRCAGNVDELAGQEVVGGDLGADGDQLVGIDAELGDLPLRLDRGAREVAALGFGRPRHLARAGAELEGGVAVLLLGPLRDDLAVLQLQHRHRDLLARVGEDAGHAQLLCDHSRAHRFSFLPAP
jgi:hypothetical protein